jgi:hypothetical protein
MRWQQTADVPDPEISSTEQKILWNQGPLDTAATNGLLCQPRVSMMMEKSVEWLAGETEVLGENLPQCRFVHHKHHMLPGREPGPPRWEASA